MDKISIHKKNEAQSKKYKAFNNHKIEMFQAQSFKIKALSILDVISKNTNASDVKTNAENAIESIESSYVLYQNLTNAKLTESQKTIIQNEIKNVKEALVNIATSIDDKKSQFELLKLALQFRTENFSNNEETSIDLLTELGSYGTKINDEQIKIEALNFSQKTYNIINKTTINKDSVIFLAKVLEYMKDIFRGFGDLGKAKFLEAQINEFSQEDFFSKQQKSLTPIVKLGEFNQKILDVKKQIQETILNPIQSQAAQGKWTNIKLFTEYGISGYVKEIFIKKQLGQLNDKDGENYKIALDLCFEAINLGIMNSENKNPICSSIFAQKYPDVVKDIIKNHPGYFIDGYILKNTLIDAHNYSEDLINQSLNKNGGYNCYLEETMIIFIQKYNNETLAKNILNPIKELILDQNKSENIINYTILTKLSSENLNKVFGNNLTELDDFSSIVRILTFKTIVEKINSENSKNFTAIKIFNETYPELAIRINQDHPEYYLNNEFIKQLCVPFVKEKLVEYQKNLEIKKLQEQLLEQKIQLEKKAAEEKKQLEKQIEEEKRKLEEKIQEEMKKLQEPESISTENTQGKEDVVETIGETSDNN